MAVTPYTITAADTAESTKSGLAEAVHKHRALSRKGMLERMFTFAFRGLVYPQIWEDPVVCTPSAHVGHLEFSKEGVIWFIVVTVRSEDESKSQQQK